MKIVILILVLSSLLGLSRSLLSQILNVKIEEAFLNKVVWIAMRDILAVIFWALAIRLATRLWTKN